MNPNPNANPDDIIINGVNKCLLSSSIKCSNNTNTITDNHLYSSKILANNTLYKKYINKYKEDHLLDPTNKYLVVVKDNDTCNINKNLIRKCSNLEVEDTITNTLTEESYSLQYYIDNPLLLKNFMENEKNWVELFLLEFKKMYEALMVLHDKGIAHLMINPKNITFNQKTKKMKFINFGQRINKNDLIARIREKKIKYNYEFNIYQPLICFFFNVNLSNFEIIKLLNDDQYRDFIYFLKNIFFDEPYSEPSSLVSPLSKRLKLQFKSRIASNKEKFEKYKMYIKSHHTSSFFFSGMTYLKKIRVKTFLKYAVNSLDIFGLSTSLMAFTDVLKNNYPFQNISGMLLDTFKQLSNNFPSLKNNSWSSPKKAFIYMRMSINEMSKHLKKKDPVIQYNSQYKLKPSDITLFNNPNTNNTTNKYIINNGKLMRAFDADNVFTYLNKLSHHNYNIIKKNIDDNKNSKKFNNLIVLINKEAYHKIKYGTYCKKDEEINIYTKKCTQKCPKNYQRDFNDKQFRCLENSKVKTKSNKSNKSNKLNKSNKIKYLSNKSKNSKTFKKCPDGYERNPFTKKCTKKCSPGYIRNLKFNCIPEKDVL